MSSRKVMQAPAVRQRVPGGRRRVEPVRGFWEWILGTVYG